MNDLPANPEFRVQGADLPPAQPNPGGGGSAAPTETRGRAARAPLGGGGRGFWALIVTQFQGAFSDNVLKNLVVFVALFGTTMTLAEKNSYGESIGALFSLPFILFSMTGGFLADRFSKRSVMLGVKVFELFIMTLVFAGLWSWNKYLLLASVFLMGTHSAIFGPSKYGSLPEIIAGEKIVLGQRHPRTRHLHGHHPRHRCRRADVRRHSAAGNGCPASSWSGWR